MQNSNVFGLFLATLIAGEVGRVCEECRGVCATLLDEIHRLVVGFLGQPISPEATFEFETSLAGQFREVCRRIVEVVYNRIEADDARSMPQRMEWEGHEYSRKNHKTNNRGGVGTLFGQIELLRFSYEPLQEAREDRQKSFPPLELLLGVVASNATPALAERVGREAAEHTQEELLERLRRDHNVDWSVEVLRKVTAAVSQGVAEYLHDVQKAQLLKWLKEADSSKGRRKIVLAMGRDGIMLPIRGEATYKEGAVATIAIYDRRGRRRGTIYLGQMPKAYQMTLSEQLTRLVREVLEEWDGPWPRLVYITDAGYHPTEYFENVLKRMADPRHPGQRMDWTWIVDFYHACEYLSKLAPVLFDDSRGACAWSRRMRHRLKHEPNAVFRILHSAAKYRSEHVLTGTEETAYQKAYQYLHTHKAHMDYTGYRRMGLPMGSGVTEAACKTVFTQRFKESGMSWGIEGGQVILTLRLATLSRVWDTVFHQYLAHRPSPTLPTKHYLARTTSAKAA
jgi:hypothetical protein